MSKAQLILEFINNVKIRICLGKLQNKKIILIIRIGEITLINWYSIT